MENEASTTCDFKIEKTERNIYCNECGKLLTRILFAITMPTGVETISKTYPELEIKVASETKCRHCKGLSYKLFVI